MENKIKNEIINEIKNEVMLTPLKKKEKHIKLAEALIGVVVSNIKSKIHAFIPVLSMMEFVPVREEIGICTNGEKIFYDPKKIIHMAKKHLLIEIEQMLFHILFHGLLGHFENTNWTDKKLSWAVKDLQVVRCMHMIYPEEEYYDCNDEFWCQTIDDELYFKAKKNKKTCKIIKNMGRIYKKDDHRFWDVLRTGCDETDGEESGSEQTGNEASNKKASKKTDDLWKEARKKIGINKAVNKRGLEKMLVSVISKEMRSGSNGKYKGEGSANNENVVEYFEKSSNSYKELLEKISKVCETVLEEQELDKVLYQYGLELYGDVPLVEPEEFSEKKCLHTIVIAVDTSGSCTHRAQLFLGEVAAVLDEIKNLGRVEHVCYLECDTEICTEEEFYNIDNFIDFGKTHTFHGGGGTDFTPVFEYADELLKKGERVDALIYITDGYGNFPEYEKGPEYPVYLLLDVDEDEDEENLWIPNWAESIRLL